MSEKYVPPSNPNQPPFWKNFGKQLADLFKEQFEYKKQIKLKTSTANGVTLVTSAEAGSKPGEFVGNLKASYKQKDFGKFEAELSTTGTTKYFVKATKVTENLAVKLSGDEKPVGKVEIDYAQEFFASSFNVEVAKDATNVESTGAIGYDGLSVGGQVKYNITNQNLADVNAGAEYSQPDFTVTLKTSESANKIDTSYLHKINPDLSLGASFLYDVESAKRVLTAGGSYKLDERSSTKFKADTNGILSAVLEHRLPHPGMKFILSEEFNAKSLSHVPEKFGLVIHFGDD